MLKAIFFDVGQTLCFADFNAILAPLHQRGIAVSNQQWNTTLRITKLELDRRYQSQGLQAPDQNYWQSFYDLLLTTLNLADVALRDALVRLVRQSSNWNQPQPGTRELLQRLGQRYKLGVISNADGHIEQMLQDCNLADCFLNFTDSGLVGIEKPNATIFDLALTRMGVAASDSLYVGDIYSVDYQGATAVGMQAMVIDVADVYHDTAIPRVASLLELEAWLISR